MANRAEKKAKAAQPADLLREWSPWLRQIEPYAELDYSWGRKAITVCDMRSPAALRYKDLYTDAEIAAGRYSREDLERRVRLFMDGN